MAAAASEPPMAEQVITEFFAKSLHIILESRSPYESSRSFTRPSPPSSPLSGSQPRDRWFNLALRDCPAALENFDLWRQSNLEPLVIDIVMLHRDSSNSSTAEGGKIIERWVIQYETSKSGIGSSHGSKNRKSRNSSSEDHSLYRSAYKGSTLLFRSLHLLVRLLPAYNLFRDLNSSGRIRPLNLSHKISSFVEPFTRAEDAGMKHYAFAPIETLFGHLSLSVTYVPVLEVVAAPEPTRPMPTELIPDYVGSPTTDFLRQFSSLPSDGIAPACAAMTRRHSWSIDHAARSSGSPSPSSMNSEPCGRLQPRVLMHDNPQTARPHPNSTLSPGKKKGTGFEECYPSPPLSPSPSRSPSASYPKNLLFRFESAPVVIPTVRDGGGGSALPPSPSLKGKHQLPCQSYNLTPSPDGSSNVRKDLVRFGEYDNKKNLQKVLSSGKDDLGYFHGLKFTRTSSKLFITDELDERELAFVWEDRDTIIDQLNRARISDSGGQGTNQDTGGSMTRTPAAAICALVGMLKTAQGLGESRPSIAAPPPPVPQESSSVQRVMTEERGDTNAAPSSALRRARTAADALEELKKYKEIKESILGHAKASPRDPMEGQKPADRDP